MADLATRASVKEHLGISATTWDAHIDTLITRVSAAIERDLARVFASANYTEYYDGDGSRALVLRHFPVTGITSIHVDNARETYNATTLVDSDDYTYDSDSGIVTFDARLARGNKNVRVVYTAGYATVPADIALACVLWVAHLWNRRKSQGATSEGMGGYSVGYEIAAIPIEVEKLLLPYRTGVAASW